ncbi:MAG: type 4a pilus biogenesis protein PilO [Candidatus Omnitrophica bacterium]|nr:type 4a pilus biogenesis protein PilO [Candidatus Omnitrophota bacterium]
MSLLNVQAILEAIREQGWIDKLKDRRFLLRVAVNAAVFLILIFAFILPALGTRSNLKKQLSKAKSEIKTAQRNIADLPKLKADEKMYLANIETIKKALYTEAELDNVISAVSEMARESNVLIAVSEPENYPEELPKDFESFYKVSVYRLECEADYHSFGTFISKLEAGEKLLKIIRLTISPLEGARKNRAELTLAVFYLKP